MIADIVGFGGQVAWIGRSALDRPGSPWILAEKEQLHYRIGDRVCYTLQGDDAPSCYRIDAGLDPMLAPELPRVRADLAELRFVQSVAIAARQAITQNLLMWGEPGRPGPFGVQADAGAEAGAMTASAR